MNFEDKKGLCTYVFDNVARIHKGRQILMKFELHIKLFSDLRCVPNCLCNVSTYVRSWTSGLPGRLASGHFLKLCQFKRWPKMIVISFVHL